MSEISRAWKVSLSVLVLLVLLSGGALSYWYFAYHTKSPDYSVRQITEAVEKHDINKFNRYVNVERLTSAMADSLTEALLSGEQGLTPETRQSVASFTKLFREPLISSLRTMIDNYVRTGEWKETGEKGAREIDTEALFTQTGLKNISFVRIEEVNHSASGQNAHAKITVHLGETDEDYIMEVLFTKDESGVWTATEFTNLYELVLHIKELRRNQLKEYIKSTRELMARHDETIKLAELQKTEIISGGSLARTDTRIRLKELTEKTILKDWNERYAELEKITPPASAKYLHRLRLKLCKTWAEQATAYAKWLEDKDAATVRTANEKTREAKALEREQLMLLQRVKTD